MKLGSICGTAQVKEPELPTEISIPTLESIAYQRNDKFGQQIEEIVIKFMEKIKAGASAVEIDSDHGLKEELQKLVHKRLGVKAIFYCNGMTAATMPNTYVDHSPVLHDAIRDYLSFDQGGSGAIRLRTIDTGFKLGTVNTETAKITGWLSEQEVAVYINFNDLMSESDYSSAELTAIILHELGHDFEGAAMAIRATGTNLILSDIARHISSKDRGGDQEYVYRELLKVDSTLDKDTVDGLMNGSPVVMGVSAFRLAQGTIRTLSGSRVYTSTNYEALSDSFATRFGYGDALATGLGKIADKQMLYGGLASIVETFVFSAVVWSLYGLLVTLLAGAITGPLILAILFRAAAFKNLIDRNRTSKTNMVYDDEYDRFVRIKQDLINGLKDAKISSKEKRAILEQLALVDKTKAKVVNVPKPVRMLLNVIFPAEGNAQRSIDAQKRLESIIANDIFISANKLALKSA